MAYTPTLGTRPEDLGVNVFSPVAAAGSQTEYNNVYDRPIAEFTDVFLRHVKYDGFGVWLKSMGYSRGKDTPTTGHYEEPWSEDLFKLNTVVTPAGGAGDPMIVSITADSMYDTSMTVNGSARETSYPVVGDIIEAFDGVQARITAKDVTADPHRFTLTPVVAANDLDDSFNAGESYHIVTNLSAEGSGLPAMRTPRVIKWSNTFAIVKSAYYSSGTEWTNRVYFDVAPGQQGSVNVMVESHTLYDFEKRRDGVLLFGQQMDNITEFVTPMNADMSISGTEGFIPYAKVNGTTDIYTAGSFTLDDLDNVGNILEDERAMSGSDVLCWQGTDIYTEIENYLTQVLTNDLTPFVNKYLPDYTKLYKESFAAKDSTVDWGMHLGFTSIRKRGFNFYLKKLAVLSDIRRAGAEGYLYPATSIYCPLEMVLNRKTDERLPIIGYEYKELNGYSREMVFGQYGGVGVANTSKFPFPPSGPNDIYSMGLVSEIAGHWACGNKIVYQEPAVAT